MDLILLFRGRGCRFRGCSEIDPRPRDLRVRRGEQLESRQLESRQLRAQNPNPEDPGPRAGGAADSVVTRKNLRPNTSHFWVPQEARHTAHRAHRTRSCIWIVPSTQQTCSSQVSNSASQQVSKSATQRLGGKPRSISSRFPHDHTAHTTDTQPHDRPPAYPSIDCASQPAQPNSNSSPGSGRILYAIRADRDSKPRLRPNQRPPSPPNNHRSTWPRSPSVKLARRLLPAACSKQRAVRRTAR